MKLGSKEVFIGIVLSLLALNISMLFGLQELLFARLISFVSLTFIPGLLLVLALKMERAGSWECLVYIVGLSISLLMFVGWTANLILPILGVPRPLSPAPLLMVFNTLMIALGAIARWRNKALDVTIAAPKLDRANKILSVIPILFPPLSILGAIVLNNGGPNHAALSLPAGIAIYVLSITFLRNRVNANIYPLAVWMISISLLLRFSMRSWSITGHDLMVEYQVFWLTREDFLWALADLRSSYNVCLSITILPTILYSSLMINEPYLFKLIIPLICSLLPVAVYLLIKRYVDYPTAFLASVFFMSQTGFLVELTMLARQSIALLFFALALLVLFDKELSGGLRNLLFVIFCFSTTVSHYSTGYISIGILGSLYCVSVVQRLLANSQLVASIRPSISRKHFYSFMPITRIHRPKGEFVPCDLGSPQRNPAARTQASSGDLRIAGRRRAEYRLSLRLILIAFLFTLLWNTQLAETSDNVAITMEKILDGFDDFFAPELRAGAASLREQLALFYRPKDKTDTLKAYVQQKTLEHSNNPFLTFYSNSDYAGYELEVRNSREVPTRAIFGLDTSYLASLLDKMLRMFVKVCILTGTVHLLSTDIKKSNIDAEYVLISIICFVLLLSMVVIPSVSINYGLDRLYLQTLVPLSLCAILGVDALFGWCDERVRIVVSSIVLVAYFLFVAGAVSQVAGGKATVQLNNYGEEYDKFYTRDAEIQAIYWLARTYDPTATVIGDWWGRRKLSTFGQIPNSDKDILPSIIDKEAYVFLGRTNTVEDSAYVLTDNSEMISYNLPIDFLDDNKNLIYSNGEAAVFR